jgi:transposase
MSAPEITRMLLTDESHVCKVIHDFNRHGFESLRPRFRGGRPPRIQIDDEAREAALDALCERAALTESVLRPLRDLP